MSDRFQAAMQDVEAPDGDPREKASRELAERLATPEGLRLARLLQASGTFQIPAAPGEERAAADPAARPASPGASPHEGPRPISIWQPREDQGATIWVRPEPGPLGDHYASTLTLAPGRGPLPRRVAFFGESAAAGYLYAPHLTPARLLADQLRVVAGPGSYEVIDLARTNETLGSLAATVEASLQLDPDLLLIFAGNNWGLLETPEVSPYVPSVAGRQEYAAALRGHGLLGPARLARERLAALASAALGRIARAAGGRIPVVLLLPEVNLADWENPQPTAWLPGDDTARWHALFARGQRLSAAGDTAGAEETAWRMIELDGGACPTPFRLLARALAARGRMAEARDAAISEVDALHYPLLALLAAPQASTAARRTLEVAAALHGFATVDLREVFAAHTGSALPGRRTFLDYCHLTSEGMHVAMAAATAEVLRLAPIPGRDLRPEWRDLVAQLPAPEVSAEAEALAKLGAAVHTAHRLLATDPARPLLAHWCREALAASPGIAATMLDLAEARAVAPWPAVLTAAQERNLSSPYRLLLQHGWRWDHLDADLLEAIGEALGDRGEEEIQRRLLAAQPPGTTADLTRPPYLWEPVSRFYPEAMDAREVAARAFFRTPWPESSFCLVADGRRDVAVEVVLRLPAVPGLAGVESARRDEARQEVQIDVGGRPVRSLRVTERWTRAAFSIDRALLKPGLNRLTLRWPAPPPCGTEALEAATRRLEEGIEADLHPVLGEVWALRARA